MYKVPCKCPFCGIPHIKDFEESHLWSLSWERFPIPLTNYEDGVVKYLCGSVECSNKAKQAVGRRFILYEKVRGR